MWLSGLRQRFTKPSYRKVPWVRILPLPPNLYMKILLHLSDNNKFIDEYLMFNQIAFERVDFYDNAINYYNLSSLSKLSADLLIVDTKQFFSMLEWETSRRHLIEFLCGDGYVWAWNDMDGMVDVRNDFDILKKFDSEIPAGRMTCITDGKFSNNNEHKLNNIQIEMLPYSNFMRVPRIFNSSVAKKNCKKDFLATVEIRPNRPHRLVLQKEVLSRPVLAEAGYNCFRKEGDPWFGIQPTQHAWRSGYPSMDLYTDVWVELVSETVYKDVWFITEKIIKPIATKTPFLVQSTPGYLEYLKSYGFKTFSSLIDESYDSEFDLHKRTSMIVDQLERIVNAGADKFFEASEDILEHNQRRLFELSGCWEYQTDIFMKNMLLKIST